MFLKNYFFIKKSTQKHGFFTRIKGLSKKKFKSLNCSSSNGDDKKTVLKNRLIAMKNLNLERKKLILIKQTHSSKVIRISKGNVNKKLEADGMITSLNDVVLGILTADCAPIIIYDNKNRFVCNLHSGWKGSLNNISQKDLSSKKAIMAICFCLVPISVGFIVPIIVLINNIFIGLKPDSFFAIFPVLLNL